MQRPSHSHPPSSPHSSAALRLAICLGVSSAHGQDHVHEDGDINHHHLPLPEVDSNGKVRIEGIIRKLCTLSRNLLEAVAKHGSTNSDQPDVAQALNDMFELFQTPLDRNDSLLILSDGRVLSLQAELWNLFASLEGNAEARSAIALLQQNATALSMKSALDSHSFGGAYEELLQREVAVLLNCIKATRPGGISSNLRGIFVGSGPMPISALLIHKLTGAQLQCLDIDQQATELATQLVTRLGLSKQLNMQWVNGNSFDYSGADFVFIASLVRDKMQVLQRITSKDTVVAVRSAEGLSSLQYEPLDRSEVIREGFNEVGCNNATATTVNSTFYFVRRL